MEVNKYIALLLCLFTGAPGFHFIYMGRYHEAKVRFLWFFFCNPVAFIKSFIDFYKIARMNKYQFDSYCMKRVKGTGTKQELNTYIDETIKPKRKRFWMPR